MSESPSRVYARYVISDMGYSSAARCPLWSRIWTASLSKSAPHVYTLSGIYDRIIPPDPLDVRKFVPCVHTHHEVSDGGPSFHCVVPVGETSGILTLSESLSRVYTRHAVSDRGSYRCGSPTAAARNRHPEDALDVLARAACPRIGAPESLPRIAGACYPALPPSIPSMGPFADVRPPKRALGSSLGAERRARSQREERGHVPAAETSGL